MNPSWLQYGYQRWQILSNLLAVLAVHGVGKWSVDCAWLKPRLQRSLASRDTP